MGLGTLLLGKNWGSVHKEGEGKGMDPGPATSRICHRVLFSYPDWLVVLFQATWN